MIKSGALLCKCDPGVEPWSAGGQPNVCIIIMMRSKYEKLTVVGLGPRNCIFYSFGHKIVFRGHEIKQIQK